MPVPDAVLIRQATVERPEHSELSSERISIRRFAADATPVSHETVGFWRT